MGEHWNVEKVDNIDQMTFKHSIYDMIQGMLKMGER